MRQTKAEIYLHLVWATKGRQPLLPTESRRDVYRCAENEAHKLGCTTLAIGGTEDHVHYLVRIPTKISVAELVKQIKGVTSAFINAHNKVTGAFRWQEGYGVFSVSQSHVQRVLNYIADQERHHAENTVWPEWEETDEPYQPIEHTSNT